MVMPRILSVGADGFLRQQPAPEFESLRGEEQIHGMGPGALEGVRGDVLEVDAEFGATNTPIGFEVRRSAAGKPAATVVIERGTLTVGSARTYIGSLDRYRLRLFLDKGCLEVYVNEGLAALYSPVAADPKDQGIALVGRAGVKPTSLGAWPLRPAKFNLDRFKI